MEKLIIFLLFIGFSAIRGLIKSANDKAEKERLLAQRGGNPGRQQKVQSEIESFLSEVGGGNVEQRRSDAETQRTTERRERRREKAEVKKRQAEEQQRQQELQQRRQRATVSTRSSRPGERRVGSGISEHVDQYINKHVTDYVDHDVEEYVEANIGGGVNEHLGNRSLEMPRQTGGTRPRNAAAKAVVALLKDPVGVRNAILVNEILSRPPGLRRRAD